MYSGQAILYLVISCTSEIKLEYHKDKVDNQIMEQYTLQLWVFDKCSLISCKR